MYKKRTGFFILAAAISSFMLAFATACSEDENYNLDVVTIDQTFTLFQDGLTIPLGSSERIRLDTLIGRYSPEASDYLKKNEDGSYAFCYNGSLSSEDILKDLAIDVTPSIDGITFSETFDYKTSDLDRDNPGLDLDYSYTFTLADIPAELKNLQEIVLDDAFINMTATLDGLPEGAAGDCDVDIDVQLPSFVSPSVIPIKGKVTDGSFTMPPVKIEKISNIEIPESGKIDLTISFTGRISAASKDADLSQFAETITVTLDVSLQNAEGKLAFSLARGVFSYSSSESTTVDLSDLTGFLQSDDLCIDIDNPVICLDLGTNIGIPLDATLELVPFIADVPMTEQIIRFENIVMPCSPSAAQNDSKSFCICKDKASVPAGYEFLEADLTKLLRHLPDSVKISVNALAGGNKSAVIEPKASYNLSLDYDINVPLALGKDFYLSAETEIDLSGIRAYTSYGEFGIKGQVLNETPLSLSVVMDILDEGGNVIPQKRSNTILIGGKSTSDIEFYIAPADNSRTIAKARFTISITAATDEPVNASDCLQFINLVAVAPEGLTITQDIFSEL